MLKYLSVLSLLLVSVNTFGTNIFHQDIEVVLSSLDTLVNNHELYVKNKIDKIAELKSKVFSGSDEEVYWKSKNIFMEYRSFESDSALTWLDKLDLMAEKLNKEEDLIFNKIERSYVLAATGLLLESLGVIDEIDSSKIPEKLKVKYFNQMTYLYSHLHQYMVSNQFIGQQKIDNQNKSLYYYKKQLEYIDSLNTCITFSDEDYLWNMAWKYRETDSMFIVRDEIERTLSNKPLSTREDAKLLYVLSYLYAEENDRIGMLNTLAYSAMADILCANREIASLQELTRHLFDYGNIDRAYSYTSLCLKNAQIYKARIRAIDLANIMDAIYVMNMERNEEREAKLNRSLTSLSIIMIIAGLFLIIITIQFFRLRVSHKTIYNSNEMLNYNVKELTDTKNELSVLNDKLKLLNTEMVEANMVKEEYIGYVFNICSNYLGKIAENHKLINRKLKTGQIDDIIKITGSSTFLNNATKEFYHNFDAVFLNLYPDFIEEFNKLLHPEDRIILKPNELLNTELRIYALVRLGITDSNKIADFLHVSPQTVYNNRVKVRNKAMVPKEEFASIVRKLGNINIELS